MYTATGASLITSFILLSFIYKLVWYDVFRILERNMGKWKCLWCSKVLEGESFMDLIAASAKEEGGHHYSWLGKHNSNRGRSRSGKESA